MIMLPKDFIKRGPVTEIIIKVVGVTADLFSIIVYDFKVCSHDLGRQIIMYSILMHYRCSIHGLPVIMTKDCKVVRNYDKDKKQCKPHAKGIDMCNGEQLLLYYSLHKECWQKVSVVLCI